MTHSECVELFALMAAAYPKEAITKPQVELYAALLASYRAAAVRSAVVLHMQKSPWFPRISDLVAALEARNTPDPDEAWADVLSQVRAVGWCGVPQWSSRAISGAVKALGWAEICSSDNLEATRAHFLRFYERGRQREQDRDLQRRWAQLAPELESTLARIGRPGPALELGAETAGKAAAQ